MSDITPGWKLVAIVAEGQPVSLQGQNPWSLKWLSAPEPPITVAHPSYPLQRHEMEIYDLESTRSIRFAAGEFSNGVWGFYVPAAITTSG
jgi:hypothetical protein